MSDKARLREISKRITREREEARGRSRAWYEHGENKDRIGEAW